MEEGARHLRSAAALAALSLMVAGCGGGGEETTADGVVTSYLDALADGDGSGACSKLTGAATRELATTAATQLPEFGTVSCPEVVEELSGLLGEDEKQVLRDTQVSSVTIDGDEAVVEVDGATSTPHLVRSGDTWLIDSGFAP
jgi:hypothetical protein